MIEIKNTTTNTQRRLLRRLQRPLQTLTQLTTLLSVTLLTASLAHAQADSTVVVIPLFGDDIPAVSHPVADPFTNSLGMQFNTLPAGSFTMGSPEDEPGRFAGETEHTVTLTKAFGMQVTEVTNGQWNTVIVNSTVAGVNPSTSHDFNGTELDSHPVERVTWFDAVFFANQLSSNEGRSACYAFSGQSGTPGSNLFISNTTTIANCTGYRLPTEAEWEYAARAGTTTAFANPISFDSTDTETGDDFNANLHAMGWYTYNRRMQNASDIAANESGTKPVARKQANAWGLYDMHGNVFEWTGDVFAAYSGNDETDPVGPEIGSFSAASRVTRGGAWFNRASNARSAFRFPIGANARANTVGFRLVLPKGQ